LEYLGLNLGPRGYIPLSRNDTLNGCHAAKELKP